MNGNATSGTKLAVLDSNVVIYAANGQMDLTEIINQFQSINVSIITYIEVLGFNFQSAQQERTIREVLAATEILPLTQEIAQTTIAYRKRKRIKLPDALIAATAKSIGADLLSSNVRDFQNLDETLVVIEPPRTP